VLTSVCTFELREYRKAEADVVVAIAGRVVVAVRRTAVRSIVVPRAAAYYAIDTLRLLP